MKLVYSNQNNILVHNAKNLIEAQGIETALKNEFVQGGVGEISAIDSWPEVWVLNDADYERAIKIIATTNDNAVDWVCEQCAEPNDPSFEICWNCQHEKLVTEE